MKIDPHAALSVASAPSARASGDTSWMLGQLLRASVNLNAAGSPQLIIGGQPYSVAGGASLRPGQELLLKVESVGQPPLLRVVSAEAGEDSLHKALRWALPRQDSLQSLLSLLVSQSAQSGSAPGSASLSGLLHGLLARIVDADQLTRWLGLRRALADSGMFLEAKLAAALRGAAPGSWDTDLLVQALRLLSALRAGAAPVSAPPPGPADSRSTTPRGRLERGRSGYPQDEGVDDLDEDEEGASLLGLVEAVVARVRVNQISSLLEQQAQGWGWSLEVPYRDGEQLRSVNVRLRKQADRQTPERDVWTVHLALDIDALGAFQGQLTLIEQDVSIALWAQEDALVPLIETHLDRLATWLAEDGLHVVSLVVHHGLPPLHTAMPSTGVLDVKA